MSTYNNNNDDDNDNNEKKIKLNFIIIFTIL